MFLMITFFILFILSLSIAPLSSQTFSILLIIEDLVIAVGLYVFLNSLKIKRIGKIKLESVQYPLTYVLRAYTSPKNLWIVFDEKAKKFRAADLRDTPVRVVTVMLMGSFLIYISYAILFTIMQIPSLIPFRLIVLFLFSFMGLYSLFIGVNRIFSLRNKSADKIFRFLNRSKLIINLIEKEKLYVQISPNFLFKEGFVNSIEFILIEKLELDRLERLLVDTARMVQKL
ncbi:hypothetical protein A3K64_02430 [Candidatus Micrarchaeota archaeon RBG_16_36_9]|nr:MAG: hypothetical protein A3K64_02430 [Candidatus Micrarchaeota archaeon RBG_16_36_9]